MRKVADLSPRQLEKLTSAARRYRLRPHGNLEKAGLLNTIDLLGLDPENAIDFALDLRNETSLALS